MTESMHQTSRSSSNTPPPSRTITVSQAARPSQVIHLSAQRTPEIPSEVHPVDQTSGLLDEMATRKQDALKTSKVEKQTLRGEIIGQRELTPQERRTAIQPLRLVGFAEHDRIESSLLELAQRSKLGLEVSVWPGLLECLYEIIEQWLHGDITDDVSERRATDAWLILRNTAETAQDINTFAKPRSRPIDVNATERSAPRLFTLLIHLFDRDLNELALRLPEIIIYALDLIYLLLQLLIASQDESINHILYTSLPDLYVATSDLGLLVPLASIFLELDPTKLPIDQLLDKTLPYITLRDPQWLPLSLNLLYHLTSTPSLALRLLRRSDHAAWMMSLTQIIRDSSTSTPRRIHAKGKPAVAAPIVPLAMLHLPSPIALAADQVTIDLVIKEDNGMPEAQEHLGLGPVIHLEGEERERIRALAEPDRATAWMRATFAPNPASTMTQQTFWSTYRAFALPQPTDTTPVPPIPNASEMIKLAQTVFPASARIITVDDRGQKLSMPKYIIEGIKFKRGLSAKGTFRCRWAGCQAVHEDGKTLTKHLKESHLGPEETRCRWSTCPRASDPPTLEHLLTHVPDPMDPRALPKIRHVLTNPYTNPAAIRSAYPTYRPLTPLPHSYELAYPTLRTPVGPDKQPTGPAFLAAFILRGLSSALKEEEERAEMESSGIRMPKAKRMKMERSGAFGLPVPQGIMETASTGKTPMGLTQDQRAKAKATFASIVEPRAMEWIEAGDLIGERLEQCIGWQLEDA